MKFLVVIVAVAILVLSVDARGRGSRGGRGRGDRGGNGGGDRGPLCRITNDEGLSLERDCRDGETCSQQVEVTGSVSLYFCEMNVQYYLERAANHSCTNAEGESPCQEEGSTCTEFTLNGVTVSRCVGENGVNFDTFEGCSGRRGGRRNGRPENGGGEGNGEGAGGAEGR